MRRQPGHSLDRLVRAAAGVAAFFWTIPASAQTSAPAVLSDPAGAHEALWSRRSATARPQDFSRQRPGELPQWGQPAGHGAGATGFVSAPPGQPGARATLRRSPGRRDMLARPATALRAAPRRPVPAETPNPRARGAAIERGSAAAANPAPRRRPRGEDDPFAPTGIAAGTFVLRPALEIKSGHDSNPGRAQGGRGSAVWMLAPEFDLRSNWLRHELRVEMRGALTNYDQLSSADSRDLNARLIGRIDVTRATRLDLEASAQAATASPGAPDLPADLAKLPLRSDLGGALGLAHRFNRFELALKGTLNHIHWDDSRLTNGASASNRDRNYDQYGTLLRGSYELTPGVKPFVEIGADARRHELARDFSGVARDSVGWTLKAGTSFEITRKLTGDIAVGYLERVYEDARLPELGGAIAEASLVWAATPLTTLRLIGKTSAEETILPGVSGTLTRDARLEVDHAFRRWLVGTLKLGIGSDAYVGGAREDRRYAVSAGLTYKLSRVAQIKGEARREWRTSNVIGGDYAANVFLAGIRLQR